ncbi:MAG: aquaporin family protein [Mycoplasma sp.]|nr:aquaporin family protein [Mycoplasma sp.]
MNLQLFLGEMFGTATLILIGNGVVSNVLYKKTGGSKGGIIAIAVGWGLAVLMGIIVAQKIGDGHGHPGWAELNPAVSMANAVIGAHGAGAVGVGAFFGAIGAQSVGAIIGQGCVTVMYWHAAASEEADTIKSTFTTSSIVPKKPITNIFTEFLGTTVLVFAVIALFVIGPKHGGSIKPLVGGAMVALVVTGIGLSFGMTGWAINPVRDLIPRIMYQFTPYKNKTKANWSYALIPVLAPMAAGAMVGAIALAF